MIAVTVKGEPIPKGSYSVDKRGNVYYHRSAELAAWEKQIRKVFASRIRQKDWPRFPTGPVSMMLEFRLRRPKTVKRDLPHVKPDIDKLCRAVFDALHGIIYKDDSQITRVVVNKYYAVDVEDQGVTIYIDKIIESS